MITKMLAFYWILLKGNISVIAAPATQVSIKNCAPFTKCITKIDGTTIDDSKDIGRYS